jgi:hypothetical protein
MLRHGQVDDPTPFVRKEHRERAFAKRPDAL